MPGWQRLAVWRTRNVVILVGDPAASRRALAERTLGCPKPACSGRLRPWTAARARWVHGPAGARLRVRPDRGRCTVCGATQVLLPAACLPRRAYTAAVVGAVLLDVERGHRVRPGLGRPPGAGERHRPAVGRRRDQVSGRGDGHRGAGRGGVRRATGCWPRFGSPRPASRLAGVLHALGGAAAAWTTARAVPAARARPDRGSRPGSRLPGPGLPRTPGGVAARPGRCQPDRGPRGHGDGLAAGQRAHRRRPADQPRLTHRAPGHTRRAALVDVLTRHSRCRSTPVPPPGRTTPTGSEAVVVGTVTVTITKNQPSPADDRPTRHAETGQSFMGTTDEDHIGKISDG